MRALKLAFVFVAALLGGIASAFGAVTVMVTPVADTANYSSGAPAPETRFVAWKVEVTNTGAGTSSPVLFFGRTRVFDRQEKAVFGAAYALSGADPRCVSSPLAPTAVVCLIPGLLAAPAPGHVFSFLVSYKTPVKADLNGVGDAEGTDWVRFRGTTIAAENRDIYVDSDPSNQVTLLSPNASQASTVCGPGDVSLTCTLFTGTNGGIPTTGDNFTTHVTAHLGTNLPTTINIVESPRNAPGCTSTNLSECYTSELTVPPNGTTFDPPLTIVLRQAISTVNTQCAPPPPPPPDDDSHHESLAPSILSVSTCAVRVPIPIQQLQVYYNGAVIPGDPCTGLGGLALGLNQNECVPTGTAGRQVFGGTDGYYQFTIISNHNGGWSVR